MKYLAGVFFAGLLACLLTAATVFPQGPTPEATPPSESGAPPVARDANKEKVLHDQLAKIAPKAVEKFKAGTDALDQRKYADAIVQYREVLKLAPDYPPALRRNGYAMAYLGQREDGLKMIKRAVELDRTTDNLMGYALTLTCLSGGECKPTQNLYELKVENDTVKGQLEAQLDEAINRPTTEDDTHPSPADRFKYAAKITSREGANRVEGVVWDLFKDREALISEMNAAVEDNLRAAMYS